MNSKKITFKTLNAEDVNDYFQDRIFYRGVRYQKQGLVKKLAWVGENRLMAEVDGSDLYSVVVELKNGFLESICSCPYTYSCKHGVAALLDYIERREKKINVATAKKVNPQTLQLLRYLDDDDHSGDSDFQASASNEMSALNCFLENMERPALIDLIMQMAENHGNMKSELLMMVNLESSDIDQIIQKLKNNIDLLSDEPAWSNHWNGECDLPDFTPVCKQMEALFQKGKYDELLDIGRYLFEAGQNQVEESDDDGDTALEISNCLAVAFDALTESSLTPVEQMIWAFKISLDDEFDLCEELSSFWEEPFSPKAWSEYADFLETYLKDEKTDLSSYKRKNVSHLLLSALKLSGRSDETLEIARKEAVKNNDYQTLVELLMEAKQYDEAEEWIIKGMQANCKNLPGIASRLREQYFTIKQRQKDVLTQASIQLDEFCESPTVSNYLALKTTATKLKIWEIVQKGILNYLEKGVLPKKNWPIPNNPLPKLERKFRSNFPLITDLVEVYILEDKPDKIIDWYQEYCDAGKRFFINSIHIAVADAVLESYPELSINIWKKITETYIAQTKPVSYHSAAPFLKKIKKLQNKRNQNEEWLLYLNKLKTINKRKIRLMDVLGTL